MGLPGLANIRGVAESVDTPEDLLTSVEEGHVVHGLLAAISADDRQLLIETQHTPDLTVAQIFPAAVTVPNFGQGSFVSIYGLVVSATMPSKNGLKQQFSLLSNKSRANSSASDC